MNRSLTRKQTGQVQKNEMRVIPKKKKSRLYLHDLMPL